MRLPASVWKWLALAVLAQGALAAAPDAATMPDVARVLSLPGLDGTRHSRAEWRGKVILLNFWASWCGPCLTEIPDLVAAQEQYGPRGLVVVGVGLDEARKLGNVARSLEINYPVLVAGEDGAGPLMRPWGNRSGVIPYTVLMDRGGKVVYVHRGPLSRDELYAQLSRYLGDWMPE